MLSDFLFPLMGAAVAVVAVLAIVAIASVAVYGLWVATGRAVRRIESWGGR
jgi:HAMP domain-containing protein